MSNVEHHKNTTHFPYILCDYCTMSTDQQAVRSRVDAEAAARFLSELAGIPVSSRTVLAWARLGRIPHQRLIGRVVFSIDELRAFVVASHHGVDDLPRLQA